MTFVDRWVERIGRNVALLNIVLIVLMGLDVILRYLFDNTKNWVIELEWHIFSITFLFGMSFALQRNEHVRVDLFYQNWSERTKKIVDSVGHLLFLTPWTIMVIYTSYKYAANSYYFAESSPNPGGLPFRYIIKSCIVIGFGLLLLQGWSLMYQNIKSINSKDQWPG